MPKMCGIPQLVSAPLNPIPTVEHFRRSHPQCEHSYGQHIYMSEEIMPFLVADVATFACIFPAWVKSFIENNDDSKIYRKGCIA